MSDTTTVTTAVTTAVMFDLDGTLLDHVGASDAAVLDAVAESWLPGRPVAPDEVLAEWARLEALHMGEYLTGTIDFAEQRRRRLRGLLAALGDDRPYDDDGADAAFTAYLSAYEANWRAFDDVEPTLGALARLGVPYAVLTNGDRDQQLAKAATLRLPDGVRVLTPADVGAAKPSATAFTVACESLGWVRDRVLYVGDNPDADARGSRAAGLNACWLNRTDHASPFQPAEGITEIKRLGELVGLLPG